MGYHFLPCERDQLYLLPPALQDWLPEGDLAWFILDAVAQMNLTAVPGPIERLLGTGGVRAGHDGGAAPVCVLSGRTVESTDRAAVPTGCGLSSAHGQSGP